MTELASESKGVTVDQVPTVEMRARPEREYNVLYWEKPYAGAYSCFKNASTTKNSSCSLEENWHAEDELPVKTKASLRVLKTNAIEKELAFPTVGIAACSSSNSVLEAILFIMHKNFFASVFVLPRNTRTSQKE